MQGQVDISMYEDGLCGYCCTIKLALHGMLSDVRCQMSQQTMVIMLLECCFFCNYERQCREALEAKPNTRVVVPERSEAFKLSAMTTCI